MTKTKLVLRVDGLIKKYSNAQKNILNGINLDVFDGDFLCVLGPSGCGKTSLIRCIAGFESFEGKIECDGKEVCHPGRDRIMVFQEYDQLFPWKTVLENVLFPLKQKTGENKNAQIEMARDYLNIVGLLDYENYYPHQLSGGMKQRVAIARGLALSPKLFLMDEPFAALDAISRNQMQIELSGIKEKTNMTVVFITHNIQEALKLGNRIVVMSKNGEIKEVLDNNLEKPVTPATEGYGKMWAYLNKALSE